MKKVAILVLFAIFGLGIAPNASAQQSENVSDINHKVDISVTPKNKVMFSGDLMEGQKRLRYVLNIYNENKDMVYVASFRGKKPVHELYDLSKLPEGKYTFTISYKYKPICTKTFQSKFLPKIKAEDLLVEEI